MEYNSKSLTREGATMLALADKEEKALIIDEVIVSEKVITAGNDISTLTMADFTSPLTYGISSKVQSDNQFSVKSVITNHWQDSANTDHTTNKDFNVALVGVVAHVDGYVDQHVLTVAVGNDPFVLPAYQGTDVSFVFGITQAYSASQNVTIKMDGSAYALATDLDDVKNLQGSIGIAIDDKLKDYAKKDEVQNLIPATVIDGSKPADFKEAVTLEKGAVDGAGNAIATTKNVSDGDAKTLTSAKEYADAQAGGKADDSKVVHTADMRKPASDVAGIEEVNAKQDKIGYTPANDTNVVHRNPDTGVVSKPTDFTNLTVNGGKSVATSDDLKSIEASAWRPIISDNYSGLCMMKYNADIGTMSLSGTIFPKMWSPEGSRSAIIIPLPSGFAMGKNSNAKISLMMRFMNNNVQQFEYALVDLLFETDGIHIVFDKVYAHTQTFIVLDGFFNSDTKETQSSSFIDFKVTKN